MFVCIYIYVCLCVWVGFCCWIDLFVSALLFVPVFYRIMVLDQGRLMEYDSPSNLLAKEQGLFKSLWKRHQASHNK